MITVCSLARLAETVERTGARRLVTLITAGTDVPRPHSIAADDHLFLAFNDITVPAEGLTPPGVEHVERLLDFVTSWDRTQPMVIHCFAGISRSTAAAFIACCALSPEASERRLAARLREASPSATPNARLVALADDRLGRGGRMVQAIRAIGRGADAFEGAPFSLDVPLGLARPAPGTSR
ncbi:tyrosine phosphatase family protein [Stappia sp.]|uniref:tyrosine phosphatase family protein n=1 Tax=Stappia sp. TaxID=1870903 RepID=UPI003A9934C2